MINIYLIILILILILHIVVFFVKKIRKKEGDLNKKLINKNFTTTDLFSIKNITRNNKLYKILIVEDDIANMKILKAQLTTAKYQVVTAINGFSALQLVEKDKSIDVVLLDLLLPDISGFMVCKKIREKFTMYEKPVIMVTSKNYIKDLVEGFEVGANDFITKPYNIYELISRMNSSISLKNIFQDNTSLKKINKLKSDIVDMAAHDLKSPLTIISGYSKKIIKVASPHTKELENAEKILKSSNKMLSIIDKLLNDSKYEKKVIHMENIEINRIIRESIAYYSDMAKSKEQNINFLADSKENYILIDINSFVTIIENLISNAIKYSPINCGIDITVKKLKKSVTISIKDCGNGFTQDEIDNIFIKFFPFTNKPTQGENSTGLGLYIINDMVTLNRGTISINSTRGLGSEFILSFPRN